MNAHAQPPHLADPDMPVQALQWSQEAEQSVLGGLMLDNDAWGLVGDLLTEGSFWHAAHRAIWAAVAGLVNANKPADVLTVFDALGNDAADCGGLAYLNNLVQSVPSAANCRRYAEIVAGRAAQRAVIAAADKALAIARESGTTGDKLDRIAAEFSSVQRGQMRKAPRTLGDLMATAIDRYTDLAEGKGSSGWATGIAPLDSLLNGGLRPGKVYGLAARPSVGKSSAARAMALHLAACGHPVLLLSQEMPADEIADAVISELGRIDSSKMQTGGFEGDDWTRVSDAVEQAATLPLFVDDDGGLTIGQIKGKARMVKGLRVLLLDYLQLSTSTLRNATTNDQVAEISKGLKQLALQMGIAVVVLSQLNRDVEKRADKEPQQSDLRDSGAIEQDIDVAVMLWTVHEPSDGPRLVGWKVPKHRGGRKGRFGMWFDAPVYRWTEAGELPDRAEAIGARRQGGFE